MRKKLLLITSILAMLTFIACGSDVASETAGETSENQEAAINEAVEPVVEDVIETDLENEVEEDSEEDDTLEYYFGSYVDLTETVGGDSYESVILECNDNDIILSYKFAEHIDVTDEILEALDAEIPDAAVEEKNVIEEEAGIEISSLTIYFYNDDDSVIYEFILEK